ncbi:ABC transporter substrate-binding protein [Vibrio salinus]|uniref:ABC transporter substrate-binding protein n=1 Tax=Vibrio salinus TaxID=2899784 RepID=UPI001E511B3D|nr:hypothetical protein [Vibrio salinus]MCE0495128.1 hypothetical protein [Vibrio salinus]
MQKSNGLYLIAISFFLFFYSIGVSAKTIVVINSYHIGYPWSDRCFQGFNDYINAGYNIISYQMDTKRIPEKQYETRVHKLWNKITSDNPDLVVTMDDNALKYFGEKVVNQIGIPLVFMGINQNPRVYFPDNKIPHYVSGIIERPLFERNVIVISQVLKLKKKKILLLMDSGVSSKSIFESVFFKQKSIFINEIQLDIKMVSNFSDWKLKTQSASNDYDALIISSYGRLLDTDKRPVSVKISSEWTSRNSLLPVFSLLLSDVGKGRTIGGLVFTGYENGVGAAKIANHIITTGLIPPIELPKHGELVFSRSELLRWNIQLPDNIEKRTKFVK